MTMVSPSTLTFFEVRTPNMHLSTRQILEISSYLTSPQPFIEHRVRDLFILLKFDQYCRLIVSMHTSLAHVLGSIINKNKFTVWPNRRKEGCFVDRPKTTF